MPPPKLTKQTKAENLIRFRLDGTDYTVDRTDITPRLERELFTQAQITPQGALQALAQGASFGLAALVWLARRQNGETVAYQTVEDALWKASQSDDGLDLELLADDAEGGDGGPPAEDAS